MSLYSIPLASVITAPPGTWPAIDDDGHPLKITYNPLRTIRHGRNKELITKISPFGGKSLLSGPIDAVIDFILFSNEDIIATKSFLLGYHPYLSPAQLWKRISDVIKHQQKNHERGRLSRTIERRLPTATPLSDLIPPFRIFKFMREWLDSFGARDFRRRSFTTGVLMFCCTNLSRDSANQLKLLYIRLFRQKKVLRVPASIIATAGKEISLEELQPNLVADYLTSIETVMYRAIQPWEFLNQAWQRDDKQLRAPNLSTMIARFNQVSNWVASQVVQSKEGHAVRTISLFIEIAKRLFDINNYNTLMEILSGLNNANISRLRSIWAEVPAKDKEAFERLDMMMAPQANFRMYRELVKVKRDLNEFVFPYLAVHLRDLTFVNEANPNFTPNKFVNFEKLMLQGSTVLELMSFKKPELQIATDDAPTLSWLRAMRALNEEEIREISLRLVPLKTVDTDALVPVLSSNAHQQWGPSALIHTVETKQLASWNKDDIEAYLSRSASKSACECLLKQVRSGAQLLHLTEDNLVSLGVSKESLSPLLAALKQLREQNPDTRVALSALLEREPHLWSVLDVAQWLVAIGLGALRQIFIFHLVDGHGLFELTDQLLADMQIRDPVHRSRILRKIALLSERQASAFNDDDDDDSSQVKASPSGGGGSSASHSTASADSSEADKVLVWCYYEDTKVELRLVSSDYKRFKHSVRKNFGGAHIRIKYQNAEGELVAVKSSKELAAALGPGRDGTISVYIFAKRRKRLAYTGGPPASPSSFRRGIAGTMRARSRSGSQQGSMLALSRSRSNNALSSFEAP